MVDNPLWLLVDGKQLQAVLNAQVKSITSMPDGDDKMAMLATGLAVMMALINGQANAEKEGKFSDKWWPGNLLTNMKEDHEKD